MNAILSTAHSTAFHIKENPYQILPHSAAIKLQLPTNHADTALLTVSAYRQTIPAMLNSNYIGYEVSFIPTECFI